MKRVCRFALLLTVALCVSGLPMGASVIFSDFGPGHSYQEFPGWTISGTDSGVGEYAPAAPFTAAVTGNVSQIDVALGLIVGDGLATVSLWTDSGGLPGTQLGSWNVTAPGVVTVGGLAGPSLTAGETYFLAIVSDAGTWAVWGGNNQGFSGPLAESYDGGLSWVGNGGGPLGAFDILGSSASVPEPATVVLLGAGLLCLLARARKRAVR